MVYRDDRCTRPMPSLPRPPTGRTRDALQRRTCRAHMGRPPGPGRPATSKALPLDRAAALTSAVGAQEPGQTDRNASRGGQRAGGQQGGRSERIFQCSGPSPHKDHRRNGNEHRQQNDGARANVAGTLRVPYAWNVFPARNVLHYRQDWQTSPTMRLLLWQTAHGVCRLLRRGGQFGGAVGLLPSEVGVAAAKMPARGRLAVNGPAEIEILDDPAGR